MAEDQDQLSRLNSESIERLRDAVADMRVTQSSFMSHVEDRLESLDRLHASMALGYMELASAVEALVAEVMSPKSEEERQAFREQVADWQKQALAAMSKMTTSVSEHANSQAPIDEAISSMARERINTPPEAS